MDNSDRYNIILDLVLEEVIVLRQQIKTQLEVVDSIHEQVNIWEDSYNRVVGELNTAQAVAEQVDGRNQELSKALLDSGYYSGGSVDERLYTELLHACGYVDDAQTSSESQHNDLVEDRVAVVLRFLDLVKGHSYPEALLEKAVDDPPPTIRRWEDNDGDVWLEEQPGVLYLPGSSERYSLEELQEEYVLKEIL